MTPQATMSRALLAGVYFSVGALCCALTGAQAYADPLSLTELNRFNTWVQCTERCAERTPYDEPTSPRYEEQRERFECLSSCGVPAHTWEKDGARRAQAGALNVYPIDRYDLKLAILEFQSSDLVGPDAERVREPFTLGAVVDFDPAQLICYGEALLTPEGELATPEEGVTRAERDGSMVILGTLCPYREGDEAPQYACPHLAGTSVDEAGLHFPFCDADRCAQPEFDFDAPLSPTNAEGVYWAGSYRPFLCPEVVCDLYREGAEPEADVDLCRPGAYPDVPRWLERRLAGRTLCDLSAHGADACALNERCVYDEGLGRGLCSPRCEAGSPCTVAHLELKSESDQELIAWVYFDHSDAPVRALDLHFTYPRDQLVLADSRRLPALALSGGADGKQLATQHLSDGTLRLSVFDTTNSDPIPYGPIIELVFQRVGAEEVTIAFTDDPELREMSMAPNHAQAREALRDNDVWGAALRVPARDQAPVQLKLWYDFQRLDAPLKYQAVQSAEQLCEVISGCALETEEAVKAQLLAKLARLQRGEASLDRSIEGVLQEAGYLNGAQSHLRLPVSFSDPLNAEAQSFSLSTWLYTEGLFPHEDINTPQVIFAHHNRSERTRFGLWLRASEGVGDSYELELFDGDLLARDLPSGLSTTHLATIPRQAWQHVSFTYDATTRLMTFYLNGEPLPVTHQFPLVGPSPLACPQFSRGRDLLLHEEGDMLGGKAPEVLYYSARESGQYKIKRRELNGGSDELVIGDGEFSYSEPDYSPLLDRVVYVSNASGSNEIWIANGSGGERHQLTQGFGDAFLGMSARSPKWAPDGTGVVFESDAFDVSAQDNLDERVYHLYYLAYDVRANQPAIPLASGEVTDTLDYQARLADQSLVYYRLTQNDNTRHHRKARWLEGTVEARDQRGRLLFEHASPLYEQRGVSELLINDVIPLSTMNTLEGLNSGALGEEVALLDAQRHVRATATGPQAIERLLFKRTYAALNELGAQGRLLGERVGEAERPLTPHAFQLRVHQRHSERQEVEVELRYAPRLAEFATSCWDKNQNGLRDSDEDVNGDNEWSSLDCPLQELSNLFVNLNVGRVALTGLSELSPSTPESVVSANNNITRSPWSKEVRLSEQSSPGKTFVSVHVTSPYNTQPLYREGASLPVARFSLRSLGGVLGDIRTWSDAEILASLSLLQRTAEEELVVRDLNPGELCWDLNQNRLPEPFEDRNEDGEHNALDCVDQVFDSQGKFELIRDAQLSPNADRALLNAVSQSRPLLLLTANLVSAEGVQNLSEQSQQLKGLSWRFDERLFPCNWVGAVQHPTQKRLMTALRGGLDELKLHAGVRDLDSIRSEAERGREWLERAGPLSSQRPRCGASHLECPPFHLCVESECVVTTCDPQASSDEPGSCAPYGAQCRLRPVTVESEEAGVTLSGGAEYVCVADCASDRECYTQTCLNGPCLFCDVNSSACAECRDVEVSLNGLTVSRTEGCPDERSFYCDAGACLTECYSFEDEQSLYLCDPVTEFCEQGRCVLRDWSWEDLSPLTFLGAADAQHALAPSEWSHYTIAIGESYPLELHAYGVSDYGASPELLVEVRGGPFYGGAWRQLGRLAVHARTQAEATRNPLILDSVHPYTDVRVRLITSPYQNPSASATGLGALDEQFCVDDVERSGVDTTTLSAKARCERRAQGSRYQLGYRLDLPEFESTVSCRERGHAACPSRGRSENDYLYGGAPGVAILDAFVSGGSVMNNLARNPVCSYAGGLRPVSLEGGPEKLFYGRISAELSHQKLDYCERSPERCFVGVNDPATLDFNGSFALLNCNYVSQDRPSESAVAEFINIPYLPPASRSGPIALDNGDSCVINIDNLRSEVCYEWAGGAVSFDPYTRPLSVNQTLEMSVSRSFGHDRGFTPLPPPSYTPRVNIQGYTGVGLLLSDGRGQVISVPTGASVVAFDPIYEGWFYQLSVAQQPIDANLTCSFRPSSTLPLSGSASPVFASERFQLVCEQAHPLTGCVNYVTSACAQGLSTGKALELSLTSTRNVTRTQRLTAFADGAFSTSPLGLGEAYSVSVVSSPRGARCQVSEGGAGVIGATPPPPVVVRCVDLPERPLTYLLTGLTAGRSLELINRETDERFEVSSATVNAEGQGTLPLYVRTGGAYELYITRQPVGFSCVLSRGIGVMPEAGVPDGSQPEVTCLPLPTYELSFPVMGLSPGETLTATLTVAREGEAPRQSQRSYQAPESVGSASGLSTELSFPELRLSHGERYSLTIDSLSSASDRCVVENTLEPGVADVTFDAQLGRSTLAIQCQRDVDGQTLYELSGRLEGVDVEGVKLSLNSSGDLLALSPSSPTFRFESGLPDDTNYTVLVARTPDFKRCSVSNGVGRISGADVTNLVVRCTDAGQLSARLNLPSYEGARVRLQLYSRPQGNVAARELGRALGELEVSSGVASSAIVSAEGDANEPLNLAVGDYHLYAQVNANNTFDRNSNEPTFGLGDRGFYRSVRVSAGEVSYVTFEQAQSAPLSAVHVHAQAPLNANIGTDSAREAPMTCTFSPRGTFTSPVMPIPSATQTGAPIVAKAARFCVSNCSLPDRQYITTNPAYLALFAGASFDLACFVDLNGSEGRDAGDLVYSGVINAVDAFAPLQIQLTVHP